MLAMSDDDSRKSPSPQRSKSTVSGTASESKQAAHDKTNLNNSIKPNMVYIVSVTVKLNINRLLDYIIILIIIP